jgi:hypothetical protein
MAQDDRGGSSIPIAPLIALLLFAGGLLVQHQPLQSDRPVAQPSALTVPHYGQDVESRLWQDPLEAVQAADREQGAAKEAGTGGQVIGPCGYPAAYCHSSEWLRKEIGKQNTGEKTLVLPVMIFGGPYAEDSEDRRRNRYAVLSNLIDSGYQPIYSRGIGYVRFGNAMAQTHGFPRLVPFERWERLAGAGSAPGFDHVYVLWLTEESFVPGAPAKLKDLFSNLLPASGITVKVIGPASEETADELWPSHGNMAISNPQCGSGQAAVFGRGCVDFLAPRLTTPDRPLSALRFSPNDRTIIKTLIDELCNRGLKLPPTKDLPTCKTDDGDAGQLEDADQATHFDHIAIVVEADTHFGRGLEREFLAALGGGIGASQPPNVHIFRYFRGLDGKTSHKDEEATKSSEPASSGSSKETTAPQERAQGSSQFDYLLRIASRVREQNDRLNEAKSRESSSPFNLKGTGRSIRAVVVLGSDVFDKLAILHALRERLPQAIFATTDLDAGFLENDQLKWTRNLVLASGHDLRLHRREVLCARGDGCDGSKGRTGAESDKESPQRGAPPFRDTYQTATFLATSKALLYAPRDLTMDQEGNSPFECARLFEIGDGSAVKLAPADRSLGSASANVCRADPPKPPNVGDAVRLATGLLFALLFGLALSWCLRKLAIEHWRALVVAAVLVGAYIYCIVSVSRLPGEEPLHWLNGVSIWPSEFIRLTVIVLGAVLLIHARSRLREGEARIAHEFFRQHPSTSLPHKHWLTSFLGDIRACRGKGSDSMYLRVFPRLSDNVASTSVNVKDLWTDYLKWTSLAAVAIRIFFGVACYLVLAAVLISLDPPIAPARGAASLQLDRVTAMAAVLSMLLVLVATLGRVAVSTLFLRRLYGDGTIAKPSEWDDETIRRFCGVSCKASKSYVDLMLSARMTEVVGDIVLYPFVLTVLLFVARSQLFDNWVTPWGLMAVIGLGLVLVIISALALRHSAERIRRYTVEQLIKVEMRMGGSSNSEDEKACSPEKVRQMREVASNLCTGAFAPLTEQPIVRALILPFGGAGAMGILESVLMAKG